MKRVVMLESKFAPETPGTQAHCVVMAQITDHKPMQFATWVRVGLNSEPWTQSFIMGHYFGSIGEAVSDYFARCRQYNLDPGPIVDRTIVMTHTVEFRTEIRVPMPGEGNLEEPLAHWAAREFTDVESAYGDGPLMLVRQDGTKGPNIAVTVRTESMGVVDHNVESIDGKHPDAFR